MGRRRLRLNATLQGAGRVAPRPQPRLEAGGHPQTRRTGRTFDVHALRTTFGTLLRKGGVAPRNAQAAMRHSDTRLTMGVNTAPKLLDVRGARDALPALPLQSDNPQEHMRATETDATAPVTPWFMPTQFKPGQSMTCPIAWTGGRRAWEVGKGVVVSGSDDKRKEPLTLAVSGSQEWAARDSNPRPHGCDPCALTS